MQHSILKAGSSACKMACTDWTDRAITGTEAGDVRVAARYSRGPEDEFVEGSKESLAISSATSDFWLEQHSPEPLLKLLK